MLDQVWVCWRRGGQVAIGSGSGVKVPGKNGESGAIVLASRSKVGAKLQALPRASAQRRGQGGGVLQKEGADLIVGKQLEGGKLQWALGLR